MALHLLERNREGALKLASALQEAAEAVQRCSRCRNLTEQPVCTLCRNERRDAGQLCVVETPADVAAIELAGSYSGRYFVLLGHLSPIDGIGPSEIGIDLLVERLQNEPVQEVIIATNPTMEGEATAHYIAERGKALGVKISRIAHGVPIGGELEYIDGGTLSHAFNSRREL